MQGITQAWGSFRAGDVPPRLIKPTRQALLELATRVASRDRGKARQASVEVSYASNDLQLRYRPPVKIDAARFELWVRRAILDAHEGSLGGVRSDVVTMEGIRDRFAHTLDPVTRTRVDALVGELGANVVDRDLAAAATTARKLRRLVVDPTSSVGTNSGVGDTNGTARRSMRRVRRRR